MSLESLDPADLAEEVTDLCPGVRAALLVGSAALRRRGPVGDFDVTALDPAIPPGKTRRVEESFNNLPLTVSSYHPLHFKSLCDLPDLVLPSLREMRKVRDGVILFDLDGDAEASRRAIASFKIPQRVLAPFFTVVRSSGFSDEQASSSSQRLQLLFQLENLIFGWLHSRIELRYSKPKWLFEDIRQIPSSAVHELVEGLAEELVAAGDLAQICDGLERVATELSLHSVVFYLRDAQSLLRHGASAAAVPSIRTAAATFCERMALRLGAPYRDLKSCAEILQRLHQDHQEAADWIRAAFLLDHPMRREFFTLWQGARNDFLIAFPDH